MLFKLGRGKRGVWGHEILIHYFEKWRKGYRDLKNKKALRPIHNQQAKERNGGSFFRNCVTKKKEADMTQKKKDSSTEKRANRFGFGKTGT